MPAPVDGPQANTLFIVMKRDDDLFNTTLGNAFHNQLQQLDLVEIYVSAKYSAELFKEYVFEEIRATEFSDKPSRKKCIFLIDKENDPYKFANFMNYPVENRFLVEIEIDVDKPRIIRSDTRLLNCNSFKYSGLIENARLYWKGTDDISIYNEILYEGYFRVKKVRYPPP